MTVQDLGDEIFGVPVRIHVHAAWVPTMRETSVPIRNYFKVS